MKNLTGQPVAGDDFLFREQELAQARALLRAGNSIKLFALRRIGKSSFLKELERTWSDGGGPKATYVDLQGENRPSALFKAVFTHLDPEAFERFRAHARNVPADILNGLMPNVRSVKVAGAVEIALEQTLVDNWTPITDAIERTLADREEQAPIFLDELSFFLEHLKDAGHGPEILNLMLAALRRLRGAGLPMAVCSSIGIESVIAVNNLDENVMNDMTSLELPLLTDAEIDGLLTALAGALELDWWTAETTRALKARLPDGVPYFYQNAVSFLAGRCDGTADSVNAVFDAHIQGGLIKDFVIQFQRRLKRYDKPDRKLVSDMLFAIANAPSQDMPRADARAMLRTDEDDGVLLMLRVIGDGFLKETDGGARVRFAFQFLRDWWAGQ